MSEDQTQAPSKLRRQKARERGQVAHSPELTSAAALLAAAFLLGTWGESLVSSLYSLVREPLLGPPIIAADPVEVVARLRHLAWEVVRPLGVLFFGSALAAIAVHQAQVQGLWAPGLLAPDPARLWTLGQGQGWSARGARTGWGLIKVVVIVAIAAWAVRSGWPAFQRLGEAEPHALARAAGQTLRKLALMLAGASLVLGLIDFGLQYHRYEQMLRMTPDQQREDQKSVEGDPALRARRRRLALAWRGGSANDLATASLVLNGPAGLTVILTGGPPPRRVSVRSIARGIAGERLRRAAESSGVLRADAPDVALRLATRRAPALPLDAGEAEALAAVWPADERWPMADDRGPMTDD